MRDKVLILSTIIIAGSHWHPNGQTDAPCTPLAFLKFNSSCRTERAARPRFFQLLLAYLGKTFAGAIDKKVSIDIADRKDGDFR
jgi:hypothetical protein